MTNWRKDVYKDSDWLYHWDIEDASPLKVEMEGFQHKEAFNPGTKSKGMLWAIKFKGGVKLLGCNATNGELIEQTHGADRDKWIGKKIVLRRAKLDKDGTLCIRVDAKPGARLAPKFPPFKYIDETPKAAPKSEKVPTVSDKTNDNTTAHDNTGDVTVQGDVTEALPLTDPMEE